MTHRLRREVVFVDTGAWIALAVVHDPMHEQAVAEWEALARTRTRIATSVPVVIETFTYLDRKGSRDLARRWREALGTVRDLSILGAPANVLEEAWEWLERREFHKLSLVDATSFVLMTKHRIRTAFAYDKHFAIAGFRFVTR